MEFYTNVTTVLKCTLVFSSVQCTYVTQHTYIHLYMYITYYTITSTRRKQSILIHLCSFPIIYIIYALLALRLLTQLHVHTYTYRYIHTCTMIGRYNQMALASLSICLSDPSTWNEMMSLADPMYLPPTKTAGTAGFDEPRARRARSISRPSGSLSSSWIAGLAPSS